MGQRTIHVCDFSKQEYDPVETFKITIKKPGKTKGQTYDLCADVAQQLLAILNHHATRGLITTRQESDLAEHETKAAIKTGDIKIGTKGEDDEDFLSRKEREIAEHHGDHSPFTVTDTTKKSKVKPKSGDVTSPSKGPRGECVHANRSGPKFGDLNGKETFFVVCKDCNQQIPYKTAEERRAFSRLGGD